MYLDHFALTEQPFAHNPVPDCFYDGASRGETLDALIYVLTHGEGVEGIIKVTGETGSGKTTLCRLLMRRLPGKIKTIYLAKPNLSRDDLFHSVADALKLRPPESHVITASTPVELCELQNALIDQYARGKQVVLLLDEAHTLTAETLEGVRVLYELESSRHKSLQIVLFGLRKLKNTLALPQMRQFKHCITHHFATQPFNAKAVKEYLIFRMRGAGYRGPDIFTSEAVSLITMASAGLAQRINILADKSLLAAFSAHSHEIEAEHVEAAIKDSGIQQRFNWRSWPDFVNRRAAAAGVLAATALSVLGWQALRSEPTNVAPSAASVPVEAATTPAPVSSPVYSVGVERAASPAASAASPDYVATPAPPVASGTGAGATASAQGAQGEGGLAPSTEQHAPSKLNIGGIKLAGHSLLEQRVDATRKAMTTFDKNHYSIQLFTTDNIQPDRMERFLVRAQNLVNLSDLYVHTVDNAGQASFKVTYGIYSSREQASAAVDELPQKYKTSFHPDLYTLSELR